MERLLRLATYNVHGFKGCDFRVVPERTFDVLRNLDADVIALQEFVDPALPSGGTMLAHWARALGMHGVYAPAFERGGQVFGNALLTKLDILERRNHELTVDRYRRRAFLDVVLNAAVTLHVMVVHLGVSPTERARMAESIEALAMPARGDVQIWMGDFNEWSNTAVVSTGLGKRFRSSPPLPTFPAVAPMLALDRVWVRPRTLPIEAGVHTRPPARWASDHLPLVATIAVDASVPARASERPRGVGQKASDRARSARLR